MRLWKLLKSAKLNNIIAAFLYADLILVLRWKWDLAIIGGLLGGLLGSEVLPISEKLIREKLMLRSGIFSTIVFQVIFIIFSFYILTTTDSYFAAFLVMAAILEQFIDQLKEFRVSGTLWDNWFLYIKKPSVLGQKVYLACIGLVFVFYSLILARK